MKEIACSLLRSLIYGNILYNYAASHSVFSFKPILLMGLVKQRQIFCFVTTGFLPVPPTSNFISVIDPTQGF